jgi:DNA-binding protein YbaB
VHEFAPEDLERITARAEDMLLHVEQLKNEIDAVVGHGETADGQVRVTAGASGRLAHVELAPRAASMAEQLQAVEDRHRHAP